MVAYLGSQNREIGIRIYITGQNAIAHFHLLKEKQEEIENEFGELLKWDGPPESESCQILLRKVDTDPRDETDWSQSA